MEQDSASRTQAAIAALLKDGDFALKTPRILLARETAEQLLCVSNSDGRSQAAFAQFASTLDHALGALATPDSTKKLSTQKELLWS